VKSSEEVNARDKNKTEKMGKDGKEEKKGHPCQLHRNVVQCDMSELCSTVRWFSLSLSLSIYTELE
jgi:hypothetical protein